MGEWNGTGSWPSLEALALFEWAGVAVDGVCVAQKSQFEPPKPGNWLP